MDKFVVFYEAECGGREVIGTFDSFEDAYDWMKKDVDYNASLMCENMSDYPCNEYTELITKLGDKSFEIEGYGTWTVFCITHIENS